jgi:hypothetical protein
MNCESCVNILQAYLDGELEGDKFTEVEHHIEHCPSCKAELDKLMKVRGFLKDLREVEIPPGEREAFISALRNRIRTEEVISGSQVRRINWRPALIAGIALVAVLIFITFIPITSQRIKIAPVKGINALEDTGIDFIITGGLSNHFLATQGDFLADPEVTGGEIISSWKILKDTHEDILQPAQ